MTSRKVLNGVLTLAVLIAIVGLYRLTPTQKDIQDPTPVNGVVGRAVETPRFTLTVDGVRVGKKLRIPRSSPDRESRTNFVLIDATVTALREPMYLKRVRVLTADGVAYLGANRTGLDQTALSGAELAPGIPVRGSFVVELPADKLPGATLQVMEKSGFNELEPEATVPLDVETPEVQDVVQLTTASAS
ncbi:hypothetical protein HPO96_21920 [Kribbella sandramycini]|uniref:DUF4352 domain-containing protein n=1 Tax=Kribbella sandramycini TaxID=60450 RepID=A0A7Y4L249_9ACTN|nr:hypothetical protein [Kribbella sandramycini]MBB6566433.1 hypothetical protein [Kribbella sandramycini]NOL42908.1 hypothetical protein [Kribbella sandramycini]